MKGLPEVYNPSYEEYDSGGLYSVDVFGPVENYKCACRKYGKPGSVCPKCGVKHESANVRITNMAKIKLPYPILHPFILFKLGEKLCYLLKKPEKIINKEKIQNFSDLHEIVKSFNMTSSLVSQFEKKGMLYVEEILVVSPSFRPKMTLNGEEKPDDLSMIYRSIINTSNAIRENPLKDITFNDSIYSLYKTVFKLLSELSKIIPKKNGLLRQFILGKRCDFTARCVIVPDPTLDTTTIGIPYKVLVDLLRPFIIHELDKDNKIRNTDKMLEDYKRYDMEKKEVEAIIDRVSEGRVVIINRQPTLHRFGMNGFYFKGHSDSVLKINPTIVKPFNADFDGDQMAIYMPMTKESQEEVKRNMVFGYENYLDPVSGDIIFKFDQDVILGLYQLYKTEWGKIKLIKEYGFPDMEKINSKLVNKILISYMENKEKEKIKGLMDLSLMFLTYNPISIPLDYFYFENILKEKSFIKDADISSSIESENKIVEKVKGICKLYDVIESGSRGSWNNIKQMSVRRGYVSDAFNNIVKTPIKHSLVEGLNEEEVFISCHGARKGLIDTAENVALSGHLTRRLVYLGSNCRSSETEDCGTEEYLEVEITPYNKNAFINRWMLNESGELILNKSSLDKYEGKVINFRSPIHCKDKSGICKMCLGPIFEGSTKTKQIGVLSAQTLGELSTQLVLRTFHFSGSASFDKESKNKEKNKDISNDLSAVLKIFSNSYPYSSEKPTHKDIIKELFTIYQRHRKDIKHVFIEIIVGEMLYVNPESIPIQYRLMKKDSVYNQLTLNSSIGINNPIVAISFENFYKNISRVVSKREIDKENILFKIITSNLI